MATVRSLLEVGSFSSGAGFKRSKAELELVCDRPCSRSIFACDEVEVVGRDEAGDRFVSG